MERHPTYHVWKSLVSRCTRPNDPGFVYYGNKPVCERWLKSFKHFQNDMGPRPSPKHEIDRIDNTKGYEPTNCRWVTRLENARNKSNNRIIEHNGESMTESMWTERLGFRDYTIFNRRRLGWTFERIISTPERRIKVSSGKTE